jgi:hypothetical protein
VALEANEFRRIAEAVVELRNQGALRILVQPGPPLTPIPQSVRFVVRRDDSRVQEFFRSNELEYEQFASGLGDVADVLSAAVVGGKARLISVRSDADQVGGDVEEPSLTEAKYDAVGELFPITELRERRWVKRTTKNDLLVTFDWEVSSKLVDDDARSPDDQPVEYATLRVESGPPGSNIVQVITGRGSNPLVLTLDREDVEYFLDSLERLRQELATPRR